MSEVSVETVFDLFDAPRAVHAIPDLPAEIAMPGMRIMCLPPGKCGIRLLDERHMININMNSEQPFRTSVASDRIIERVPLPSSTLALPAGVELRLAGTNTVPDLLIEVDPEHVETLLGAPFEMPHMLWEPVPGMATMARLALEGLRTPTPNRLLIEGLALGILGRLVEAAQNQTEGALRASVTGDMRISRVVDYIDANLCEDLSLATLAGIACLSTHHFSRAFRAATGEPPHAYVQRRRIAFARTMLQAGEEPIAEVALACGYCSQAHFSTSFKQATGTTPAAYRRQART